MKKVLLTIACAMLAFAVSAQEDGGKKFVLSGTIGINASSETYSYDGTKWGFNRFGVPSDFSIDIIPYLGYQINENAILGIGVGYTYRSSVLKNVLNVPAKNEDVADIDKTTTNLFRVGVWGRYYVCKFNKLSIFAELDLSLGFGGSENIYKDELTNTETTNGDISNFEFGAYLVPGLNYAFSDSFSMDLYFNIIGLNYTMMQTTNHQAGLPGAYVDDVTTDHNFGLNCDLQENSINRYLNTITVGFNYHF